MSALFLLVGGGNRVFLSMMSTIITDQVYDDLRYVFTAISGRKLWIADHHLQRTRFLFLNPAVGSVMSLVAPVIARQAMKSSIWPAFEILLALGIVSLTIIFLMPESHKPESSPPTPAPEIETSLTVGTPTATPPSLETLGNVPKNGSSSITQRWRKLRRSPLLRRTLLIIYFCFLLKKMSFISLGFIYQYVSEKFRWPLRDTVHLQLTRAIGMITSTVVAIPLLSSIIIAKKILRPERWDHGLVVGSAFILAVSYAEVWAVESTFGIFLGMFPPYWHKYGGFLMRDILAVFFTGIGEGLEPTLQGVAAFVVDESYTARMFTVIATLEGTGRLVGGPLMTWLFFAGYEGENKLFGLCFVASSVSLLFTC